MEQLLLFAALLIVLTVGFALLALSQRRHWRTVTCGAQLPRSAAVVARMLGHALVGFGLLIALWRDGAGFGALLWSFMLSFAACAVTLTLSWRPGWLKPLARAVDAALVMRD